MSANSTSQNGVGTMLTDIKLKALKPKEKLYAVTDEKGLSIEVPPKGSKRWRFKYRFDGKQKRLSLGTYPEVSLKAARLKRDEYREQVAGGLDPLNIRKTEKVAQAGKESFEFVAREWHHKHKVNWSESHAERTLTRLEKNIFPWLGNKNINEIKAPELLQALRRVENRGAIETAHRINQVCGQIFRYAIATGRAERDISADLKGAIPPTKVNHHASITDPIKIGELMRAIQGYSGTYVTACALKLAPLVFVRPAELRKAEWSEFDLDAAEWRIPAEKMKMRTLHIVPLSKQAITILNDLNALTGRDKYLFPSNRTKERPMSDNTINGALRRLGYTKDEMTGHGFRSMASTLLNEQGWNRDAIERQLAHSERDGVRAAYNYAEYLPERKKMMQAWADYLDGLAAGAEVIPINKANLS
jgi:integrase